MPAITTKPIGLADSTDSLDRFTPGNSGDMDSESLGDSTSTMDPLIRTMRRETLVSVLSADGKLTAVPLVNWDETSRSIDSVGYLALKRTIDVVGAAFGLVLLSPVMLVAMLLVWFEDGGPVVFRQMRVGLHGSRFPIFKIRTMVRDAEARRQEVEYLNRHSDQRTFKAENDPRILRVGRILRKYSVDEFPQLLNVLRGEMSLVGPRPPLPHEVHLYEPNDYVRLAVKPGLTCYWQVSGRDTIPFKGQVELDRKYIHQASTLVDLTLLAKTIPAMFKGVGAH
jgi:lipopolysaccharide/colanic/teichoic acid biosynthesis glycosyltransferase